MPQGIYQFPEGFLWGTATAAHQVEGSNTNNNWAAWEEQPGRIIEGQRSCLACDWWGGRWVEDFDRAAETDQNAHRFSIEWSRIQPTPDTWDDEALDHYRQMAKGLIQRAMIPMVTLHHFTDPLWFAETGGWENDEAPKLFVEYTRKVVEALKDDVILWCTINEPNVYMYSGYVEGTFPPGKQDMNTGFKVIYNMVRAHAAAYRAIHDIQPEAQVGIAHHYRSLIPARSWLPLDSFVAGIQSQLFNKVVPEALTTGKLNFLSKRYLVPEAAGAQDFIGINYYTRNMVKFNLNPANFFSKRYFPEGAPVSETGFIACVPDGLTEALKWVKKYQLPIYITENGVDDSSDRLRPRYLVEHLHKIWRIINPNTPIRGYFHWSLVDNFEWERGWTQRFGLWGLDTGTQERIRRPGVDLYASICKEHGVSSEMVEQFAPEVFDKLFPG